MLSELKKLVLSLDVDSGVDKDTYTKVLLTIKDMMGADAEMILDEATECGQSGEIYFPEEGMALPTWKRMVHAYREEKALDKANA